MLTIVPNEIRVYKSKLRLFILVAETNNNMYFTKTFLFELPSGNNIFYRHKFAKVLKEMLDNLYNSNVHISDMTAIDSESFTGEYIIALK